MSATAKSLNGWSVGMGIVVVPSAPSGKDGKPYEATITKIGRKWVSFKSAESWSEGRFDPDTRFVDSNGYANIGRVYASIAEYEEASACKILWMEYRRSLSYQPPKGMTSDRIRQLIEEVK